MRGPIVARFEALDDGVRSWRFNVAWPPGHALTPPQSVIQLAVDLVAGVDGVFTHLAGRSALEFDLVIGTQRFDHGVEALLGPWHQSTQVVDGDPLMAFAKAVIGALKLLTLDLRFSEAGALLLFVEPAVQGLSDRGITGGFRLAVEIQPVEIAIETLNQATWETDADNLCVIRFAAGHRFPLVFPKTLHGVVQHGILGIQTR